MSTEPLEKDNPCQDEEKTEKCFQKPEFLMPIKIDLPKSKAKKKIPQTESNLSIVEKPEEQAIELKQSDQHFSVPSFVQKKNLSKGPTQKLVENSIPIPYKEPTWSGILPENYTFEIIKNGVIVDQLKLEKPFLVVGRLATCDIILEHPSISRFHCVIQQRIQNEEEEAAGLYIYDLDSTHGTFLNKYKVKPKVYCRVKVGHILKFGGSTRTFIVHGPSEDEEPETEETVTQLIAIAKEKKEKLKKLEEGELDKEEMKDADGASTKDNKSQIENKVDGVNWGMGEDAVEDDEEEEDNYETNPFESNKELYLDDPKKTLRGWFEREGHGLPEYQVEEERSGVFRCKLQLPVAGPSSAFIVCSVEHRGRKKDTVVQCALEACRMLDRKCLLRQSTHASLARKRKDWAENDYYDSDEDDFLDRTGDIEKKRKLRKRELQAAKASIGNVQTYDSALKQYNRTIEELDRLEEELLKVDELRKRIKTSKSEDDGDDLDSVLASLEDQLPDKHKRTGWKLEADRLRKEELRLRKVVNVTRPLGVSELMPRKSEYFDNHHSSLQKAVKEKPKSQLKSLVSSAMTRVHSVFLEADEVERPKLRKVNCNDDSDNVKPIPYSNPQTKLSKYQQLLNRKRKSDQQASPENSFKMPSRPKLMKIATLPPKNTEEEVPSRNSEKEHVAPRISEEVPPQINEDYVPPPPSVEVCSETKIDEDEIVPIQNKEQTTDSSSVEIDSKPEDKSEDFSRRLEQVATPVNLPENIDDNEKPKSEKKSEECKFVPMKKPSSLPFPTKSKKKKKIEKSPFDFDNNYETWVPPTGQSGDGRTSLNDKLGY